MQASAAPPEGMKLPPGFELTPDMIEAFRQMPPEQQAEGMKHLPAELRDQLQKAL